MTEVLDLSIADAGRLMRSGDISSVELTEATLAQIERTEPDLRAYATVTGDRALEDARRADDELRQGMPRGPLHGIPVAVRLPLSHARHPDGGGVGRHARQCPRRGFRGRGAAGPGGRSAHRQDRHERVRPRANASADTERMAPGFVARGVECRIGGGGGGSFGLRGDRDGHGGVDPGLPPESTAWSA